MKIRIRVQTCLHFLNRYRSPRAFAEGFFTPQWEDVQDAYLARTRSRKSATSWVTTLHEKIFRFTHSMWKQRCAFLHSRSTQTAIHSNQYALELSHLLKHPPPLSMPAEDRKYFVPLPQALQYNTQRQKRLINILNTLFHSHNIRTDSAPDRLMRTWLATKFD